MWHTLLVLGRVSNLPTVWSNCIAGWLLGGGGEWQRLGVLCAGGTFLYTGGMFLNDACDNRFDARHRPERPIPAGSIQSRTVWILAFAWLAIGFLLLWFLGRTTTLVGLGLIGCIVLYDVVHKKTALSPMVMASCRFLLYLVAASAGTNGITQSALWNAVGLALYMIGLSYLARRESTVDRLNYWALLLLLAPVVMGGVLKGTPDGWTGALPIALFIGWLFWCLQPLRSRKRGAIGGAVTGLLAAIVLVDWMAVHNAGTISLAFPLLFGCALVLQRMIPAT